MPKVTFVNEKREIEVEDGANLRKEALKNGVELYSGLHRQLNCRGLGQCASCRVKIVEGEDKVSPQGLFEKLRLLLGPFTFFARLGNEKTLRLACRTQVEGDCKVETHPPINFHGDKFWS